jgi:hypothetical protein
MVPLYSKTDLPADFEAPGGNGWAQFRKTSLTRALRIDGPFRVETSESENEPFYCEDGWLALDARGYPYAIADEEFRVIYEPAVIEGDGGGGTAALHPAVYAVLQYFKYQHLPEYLQAISRPFSEVAWAMASELEGPELTVGLRKLLEAKDCMVRAALPPLEPDPGHPLHAGPEGGGLV